MNALKIWALGSLKALVGAVVPVVIAVISEALLKLPAAITVPATAAGTGAAVYAVRNR